MRDHEKPIRSCCVYQPNCACEYEKSAIFGRSIMYARKVSESPTGDQLTVVTIRHSANVVDIRDQNKRESSIIKCMEEGSYRRNSL